MIADIEKLFVGSGEFLRACSAADQFPPGRLPEVALIGRSNVGKSSLINGLTGRKNLARASKTPGRTQEIIFFDIRQTLTLVDLPGYGHAKAPRAEQDRWNDLIAAYLRSRPQLQCVFLLVDGRHGALANDMSMMSFLDRAGVPWKIVLTKMDKVKSIEAAERIRTTEEVLTRHTAAKPGVLPVSSEKKTGLEDMRRFIGELILPFHT